MLGCLLAFSQLVHAETYYVSQADGNDSHSGTNGKPLKTFWAGVEKLTSNDTLYVGPGIYWHKNEVARTISDVTDCRIIAEPRGEAVITVSWKDALEGTVSWEHEGSGIYSTQGPPQINTTGHVVLGDTTYYLPSGEESWLSNPANVVLRGCELNIPPYGFVVDGTTHKVTIRLPGNADPNGKSIVFQCKRWGSSVANGCVMALSNTKNLLIDGLVFQGGNTGIRVPSGNHGLVIRNCRFEHGQFGVKMEGSDNTVVEWCEYTFPGLESWMQEVIENSPANQNIPYHYGKSRKFHNEGGLVAVSKCRNHTCRFNYSHGAMDGFSWDACNNSEFHHNVIFFMLDNGWETDGLYEGWGKDMRIHHNLALEAKNGVVSQQGRTDSYEGPIYVYRNVFIGYDEGGWSGKWIKGVSAEWTMGYNVYNNTVWMKEMGILVLVPEQTSQASMNSVNLWNNLIIAENEVKRGYNWMAGRPENASQGNVVVTQSLASGTETMLDNGGIHKMSMADIKLSIADMGISPDDGNIANDHIDFSLGQSSPCIDQGSTLPAAWPESDKAYTGSAPDAGAIEFSETEDSHGIPYDENWPRPRSTVYVDIDYSNPTSSRIEQSQHHRLAPYSGAGNALKSRIHANIAEVEYNVAKHSFVAIDLYAVSGAHIGTIVSKYHIPGKYTARFPVKDPAGGLYILRGRVGKTRRARCLILK